jgi:hypothetical protein
MKARGFGTDLEASPWILDRQKYVEAAIARQAETDVLRMLFVNMFRWKSLSRQLARVANLSPLLS